MRDREGERLKEMKKANRTLWTEVGRQGAGEPVRGGGHSALQL